MNALEIVVVSVLLVMLAAALYAGAAGTLRLLRHDGRLRLVEAVQGQGLALPGAVTETAVRALGGATRRCLTCSEQARCDELLEARAWSTLREICPNTAYIDGLRGRQT